jgi:hypothetical protein
MPTVGVARAPPVDVAELHAAETWDERQHSLFVDALVQASKSGDVDRLDVLLDASRRVYPETHDPFAVYHMALVYAAMFAKDKAVARLLDDARVDPSHRQYAALRAACANDHVEIVQALLDDPRVDPSFDDCAVLFAVCELGGCRVLPCLLRHPAVRQSLSVDRLCEHAFRFRNRPALRAIVHHAARNGFTRPFAEHYVLATSPEAGGGGSKPA